jgi:hypothetical protein
MRKRFRMFLKRLEISLLAKAYHDVCGAPKLSSSTMKLVYQ